MILVHFMINILGLVGMLLKIIKVVVKQLTPYYLTTITSLGGFLIGYSIGSVIGLSPTITGVLGGFVPIVSVLSLLPAHYEREGKFKFLSRVPIESKYQSEVVKSIIDKARQVEKSMNIGDNVSYVVTYGNSMGVMKFKDSYIVLIPRLYVDKLLDNTYVLVAHELAHIKNGHVEKMRVVYTATLFTSALLSVGSVLYSWYLLPVTLFTPLMMNILFTRYVGKLEEEADQYTIKFVNPQEFVSAVKVVVDSFEQYKVLDNVQEKYPMLSSLFIPHRPLKERIEKLSI